MVKSHPIARTGIRYGEAVLRALNDHQPVVALESTIISHGLPRPGNIEVAGQIEQTVRDHGAVPATIGMLGGEIVVGLDHDEVVHLATADGVHKLSTRDLAVAAAARVDGATTVAATAAVAAHAGIELFATGGLGGVHRGASESYDESADLAGLSRTPIMVVCAGVKSILDVGATLERLETLGVAVVGYRTRRFPGFYLSTAASTSTGPSTIRTSSPPCSPRAGRRACTPARWWWPIRCRRTTRWIRCCTAGC